MDGIDGTATVANAYHYADNDPLNKTDPLGLRPDDDAFVDPCRNHAAPVGGVSEMYTGVGLFNVNGSCGVVTMTGKSFFGLKPAEYLFLQQHPWNADRIFRATNRAVEMAGRYWAEQPLPPGHMSGYDEYEDRPPDGSKGNAYQHIIWNILLLEFLSEEEVKALVTAHEIEETPDAPDDIQNPMFRQMDMANNYYGQQLFKTLPGSGTTEAKRVRSDQAVRDFIAAGKACSRKRGDPSRRAYTEGFESPARCGIA